MLSISLINSWKFKEQKTTTTNKLINCVLDVVYSVKNIDNRKGTKLFIQIKQTCSID